VEGDRRPIGYLLERVDHFSDAAFDRTLEANELTKRHWQILNTLATGLATNATATQAVRPFVEHDLSAVDAVIDALRARGWLRSAQDGNVEVSELGIAAHARAKRVSAIRERPQVAAEG